MTKHRDLHQVDGYYAALAAALAFAHFSLSAVLVMSTLDESINWQKRRLPPTRQEQIVDGVLTAMHPVTATAAAAVSRAGRQLSWPRWLVLVVADTAMWGCVAAWLALWLRRMFAPATANAS